METLKEDKGFYASPQHRAVLLRLLTHPAVEKSFFLTGGTALSVFYLNHRVSDDLDLFTLAPVSMSELDYWLRAQWKGSSSKIKEGPNFLSFLLDETKVEFVHDPLSNGDERPTAELEEGLALIQEKPDLLPEVRMDFDRTEFLSYFAELAEWIYRKHKP